MQPLHFSWPVQPSMAWRRASWGPLLGLLVWLAGCATPPKPVPPPPPEPVQPALPVPAPVAPPAPVTPAPAQPVIVAPEAVPEVAPPGKLSQAASPRDYRKDGAAHVYQKYPDRLYPGKLPPMLLAVGVLDVDIGRHGEVLALRWTRAPRQVPQVMAEIENLVRAAAPFPAPVRLGQVTYTEVWLWHKSGRFQLDSLTEGQQ